MSQAEKGLRGLYAITSSALCADDALLEAGVAAALRGGAGLIQYRDKAADAEAKVRRARRLAQLCRTANARFIVNDEVELAAEIGADGVHLGASDPPLAAARLRLGTAAILGASCGPSPDRARRAANHGADYLALGRFFGSRTKPDAPQAAIEWLVEARQRFDLPICVIGGLTPDNAKPLIDAGANMVAAVEGVFESLDPAGIEAAARRYAALFSN